MNVTNAKSFSEGALLSCLCIHGELCYPNKLERICLMRRPISSSGEGSRLIQEYYLARPTWRERIAPSKILFFMVESLPSDDWRSQRIWIYSPDGDFFRGEDYGPTRFSGRPPEALRFHKGDFVLFWTKWHPFELQLGLVLGLPYSSGMSPEISAGLGPVHLDELDDTYTVYSWDGEDFTHDHLPECCLFKPTGPIGSVQRTRLQDLLSMSVVMLRA